MAIVVQDIFTISPVESRSEVFYLVLEDSIARIILMSIYNIYHEKFEFCLSK